MTDVIYAARASVLDHEGDKVEYRTKTKIPPEVSGYADDDTDEEPDQCGSESVKADDTYGAVFLFVVSNSQPDIEVRVLRIVCQMIEKPHAKGRHDPRFSE